MLTCRYDKDANPNLCGGCIRRKPATINQEFEKAVKDMEEMNKCKYSISSQMQR